MRKLLLTALALALAAPALAAQQDIAQISAVTASREALRTAVNTQLSAVQSNFDEVYAVIDAGPVYVNASAPADTKVVWIDTDQSNAIKVYVGGVWTAVGSGGEGSYTLPTAAADTLGGIKVGARLTITDGVLSADVQTPSGSATYPSAAGVANWDGSAWGTSYTVGAGASNLVQLNASAQLPAVSADLLTVTDTGSYFTTDTVGAALQELGSGLADVTEITLDPNTLAVTDGVLAVIGGTGTGGYLATPPTYSDEACTPGQYAATTTLGYICVASGDWNTFALTDWSNPAPVPPTLTSATVGSLGLYADLLFSETVEAGTGGNGGWSMSCATTGAISMTYSSGGTTNTLAYSLSDTPIQGETCTVAYTQPTDGIEAVDDGTDLATISSAAVTNNSTVSGNAYMLEEGFEGVGLPSGWTEIDSAGTRYYDYTPALSGTESMRLDFSSINPGAGIKYLFASPLSIASGSFIYQYASSISATASVARVRRSGDAANSAYISIDTSGHVNARVEGAVETTGTTAQAAGSPFKIWWEYELGASSSTLRVWVSATNVTTRPSEPEVVNTRGNTTPGQAGGFVLASDRSANGVYDDVKID